MRRAYERDGQVDAGRRTAVRPRRRAAYPGVGIRDGVGNLLLSIEERRGLYALLYASRRMDPGELREADHPRVWLWSDLHLGHAPSISVFGRPYETPEEMDDELFGAWRRVVDPGDTVIVLGDVTVGGLSGRRLKRLRGAPGHKVLVLGNHEFDGTAAPFDGTVVPHVDGFDEVYSTLYITGHPELLLTPVGVVVCVPAPSGRSRGLRERARACTQVGSWADSAHQRGGRAGAVPPPVSNTGSAPRGATRARRGVAGTDDGRAVDSRGLKAH